MSTDNAISERYRRVAAGFTDRVDRVAPDRWDDPTPCEGWVARDVVRHLVEWVPSFFQAEAGVQFAPAPSADADPAAAWRALDTALQAALDDPAVASRSFEASRGPVTVEDAIAQFVLGDVLVHTWDLARATGLDERLDPDEVHRMCEGMAGLGDLLEKSGHFGPRVEVAADADEQTLLLAFTGRRA